jgi:hypothetical protein
MNPLAPANALMSSESRIPNVYPPKRLRPVRLQRDRGPHEVDVLLEGAIGRKPVPLDRQSRDAAAHEVLLALGELGRRTAGRRRDGHPQNPRDPEAHILFPT